MASSTSTTTIAATTSGSNARDDRDVDVHPEVDEEDRDEGVAERRELELEASVRRVSEKAIPMKNVPRMKGVPKRTASPAEAKISVRARSTKDLLVLDAPDDAGDPRQSRRGEQDEAAVR